MRLAFGFFLKPPLTVGDRGGPLLNIPNIFGIRTSSMSVKYCFCFDLVTHFPSSFSQSGSSLQEEQKGQGAAPPLVLVPPTPHCHRPFRLSPASRTCSCQAHSSLSLVGAEGACSQFFCIPGAWSVHHLREGSQAPCPVLLAKSLKKGRKSCCG